LASTVLGLMNRDFFASASLTNVDGAGHFTPVECLDEFAELISRGAGASAL
jgi:hypothetical protein